MLYILVGLAILLLIVTLIGWLGSNVLLARRKPDPPASPADYDLAFEDVDFTTSDGLTLRGWHMPAPSPSASLPTPSGRGLRRAGSNSTIIICPGHNGSMDADVVAAQWLHAAGFNVLMFDWRGHGRSEGTDVSMGALERLDLLAAVTFAKSCSATSIGVLGFSMGGAVALSTAAGCPDIHAVCSDGGFARITAVVASGLRERGLPSRLAAILGSIFVFVAGLRLGIDLGRADPIRWVDRIAPRPILLIHGERDPFVPTSEVEALLARAGQPKELWRVPGAGHREIHVLHAEEYCCRVVNFFKRAL